MTATLAQINAPLTGVNAPYADDYTLGEPDFNGANGLNAESPQESFDDQAFDSLSIAGALFSLTPVVNAGNGSTGYGGEPGMYGEEGAFLPSPGGAGGNDGNGGNATLQLEDDTLGTSATPYQNSMGFNMLLQTGGGVGGAESTYDNEPVNSGDAGGAGWAADEEFGYAGATGANGGLGGNGGNGGSATSQLINFTANLKTSASQPYQFGAQFGATINVLAYAGDGSGGGDGGAGGAFGGPGGSGGEGGVGGTATAEMMGTQITANPSLYIAVGAAAGAGGSGGNGGAGGQLTSSSYGPTGAGGVGNAAGNAYAVFSSNTVSGQSLEIIVAAGGAQGGTGGIGPEGVLPGTGGPASQEYLTFTNNDITVEPGSTASNPNALTLALYDSYDGISGDGAGSDEDLFVNPPSVYTDTSSGVVATPEVYQLSGGSGGNLAFSGNTFTGTGSSTLNLDIADGGVNVNALASEISIGGSPANAMTGFTTFFLDSDDTIEMAPGDTVHLASDPDTIVITAGDVGETIENANATNFVLDFSDFSGLTLQELQRDATVAGGNETITLPGGAVTLVNFTGTLTSANTEGLACYARGTRILTVRGDVAIEDLKVGDVALTVSGVRRPVVWLGWRKLDLARHPDPAAVRPIRIAADAFGDSLPKRDLWVSPGHNLAFEGALIPASALVNGVSVQQIDAERVEYWHVELDAHDVLLAEGLPAESYLDTGNRAAFANGGAFVEAHPDFAPKHWADTCLPLACDGPAVAAGRARLRERLFERGWTISQEPDAHLLADGRRIDPIALAPGRLAFALAEVASDITLVSRGFTPAHTLADSQDLRRLGLCVRALQVDGSDIPIEDDARFGRGWHAFEGDDNGRHRHRWSDGAARLPPGARLVLLDLAGQGHYWGAPPCDAARLSACGYPSARI